MASNGLNNPRRNGALQEHHRLFCVGLILLLVFCTMLVVVGNILSLTINSFAIFCEFPVPSPRFFSTLNVTVQEFGSFFRKSYVVLPTWDTMRDSLLIPRLNKFSFESLKDLFLNLSLRCTPPMLLKYLNNIRYERILAYVILFATDGWSNRMLSDF